MKFMRMDGVVVEIPTLRLLDSKGDKFTEVKSEDDVKGEFYIRVENEADLLLAVIACGWESIEEFERDNGAERADVIGHWWLIIGDGNGRNRLYILDITEVK